MMSNSEAIKGFLEFDIRWIEMLIYAAIVGIVYVTVSFLFAIKKAIELHRILKEAGVKISDLSSEDMNQITELHMNGKLSVD